MSKYDPYALDAELKASGLDIHGCSSTGRIDWRSPPTPAQEQQAQAVLAVHDPEKRARENAALQARVNGLFAKGEGMTFDEFREWSVKREKLRTMGP